MKKYVPFDIEWTNDSSVLKSEFHDTTASELSLFEGRGRRLSKKEEMIQFYED
jgi:hypothetical protein